MSAAQEEHTFGPGYWLKLALFLVCAVAILVGLHVANQAVITLRQLEHVEADRDAWQHPAEIIQALRLRHGDSVLDLGCGSGYFSLKLSDSVGPNGKVIADEIRRLSLAFLWMRAVRNGNHNVILLHGKIDGPHLRTGSVNAVLIANTYHEFTMPRKVLGDVRSSLIPGGRVVIVDRLPLGLEQPGFALQAHEISPRQVEADLAQSGFTIDIRKDNFIQDDSEGERWWMIVAHRL